MIKLSITIKEMGGANKTQEVETGVYAQLPRKLRQDHGYNQLDALLVLKDILGGLAPSDTASGRTGL